MCCALNEIIFLVQIDLSNTELKEYLPKIGEGSCRTEKASFRFID